MQTPKLKCDQCVCVFGPQWMGTIWPRPLPLTRVPDSLVCEEARHRLVKPRHTWPHGCNLARSVRGQSTDSGKPYPAWQCMAYFLYFHYERANLQYTNIPFASRKNNQHMAIKYYYFVWVNHPNLDQEEGAYLLGYFHHEVTMVPLWSCLKSGCFLDQPEKGSKLIS